MEIIILVAMTTVNVIAAFYFGKNIAILKYQKKICGLMAEIVRKNNEKLKNCDAEKVEPYKLLTIIERTRESLRIYDMVIEEFKKIN